MNTINTKQKGFSLVLPVLIAAVLVLGLWAALNSNLISLPGGGGVAAKVNGETITKKELDARMARVEQNYGMSFEATEVLSEMVDELLVLQDAARKNVTVTEDEINEEYQSVAANIGGEEALLARLAEINLSSSDFRKELKSQMIIQRYLGTEVDSVEIVITDEEIEALYNEVNATQNNLPPLDEVREEIRLELTQQKRNQHVSALLEELRENANIEILI